MKRTQPESGTSRISPEHQKTESFVKEKSQQQYMKKLAATLKRYQDIIANVDDMIFETDQTGHILFVSPNFETILGYKSEEIIGKVPTNFMPPDEAKEKYEKFIELATRHKKVESMEMTYIHKDGHLVTLETNAVPFFSSDGKLLGYRGVNRNTTERKRAEEQLRNEKLRLEVAQESAQAGTFEWDIKRKWTVWSDQLKALYGFAPDEFKGFEDWSSRVHPDDLGFAKKALREALSTGKYDVDFRIIWPNGSIHWLAARGKVIYDEQNQPVYMTGINMDITKRKQAEEELKKSEETAKAILNASTQSIFLMDTSGMILALNAVAAERLGCEPSEMLGRCIFDFLPPDVAASRKELGKQVIRTGKMLRLEDERQGKWFDSSVYPIFNKEGRVSRWVIFSNDITERKQAEEALKVSEWRLKASVKELEIRNRLADIFLTVTDDEMYGEVLQVILKFTNSPYGVFGYIDENGDVVAPSLTRDVWEECRVNDKAIRFPRSEWKDTVWVRAILQKKTIISNQPGRVPDGHIPITCVMVTPLLFQDRCIGYLKVANRPSYYNDNDRNLLESIAGHIAPALDARLQRDFEERKRKAAEEALRKSKSDLEQVVRDRTAQLSDTIASLMREIDERKRSQETLRAAQKKLRAMASEIVLADERTRQHFATDLHDSVVQTMGAAKLRSHLIEDKVSKEAQADFTELQKLISQSITQARLIMSEMSPPVLYELGFEPALEWLTEQIGSQYGVSVVFKAKSDPQMIHEIHVMLFQATRELLMNVVKHANAKSMAVKVSANGANLKLEVKDDGKGFDIRQAFRTDVSGGGFGLFSIRERLRHFGGELHIRSKPGKGTRVIMTVPRLTNGNS